MSSPPVSRRRLLALGALSAGALVAGCQRRAVEGLAPLPPGVAALPGVFRDVCPRWSPDGRQIAFLRATTDRRYQLHVADADLTSTQSHLPPLLINPDRPLRCSRAGHCAPDGLAWSPDSRHIVFPRVEWFSFENDERLPGTGLWEYGVGGTEILPLAVHPHKYEDDFYYYRSPVWSSSVRIAFIGEGTDGSTALLIRDRRLFGSVLDSPRPDAYHDVDWPAWSPDGRSLAFRQGILRASTADNIDSLRVISPGGTKAGKLFALTPTDYIAQGYGDDRDSSSAPAPRIASVAWSPDGTRIAFTVTPDALDRSRYAVYVKDVGSGRAARRVSPRDGRGYVAPIWIDAERIGAIRPAKMGWEAVALSAMGMRSAELLCDIPSDDYDWSPDRKQIVCASVKGGAQANPLIKRSTGL